MALSDGFFETLARYGLGLYDRVLSRDQAHLRPAHLSQAAARRLRAGIRALEAYVRRLILLLALRLEPDLPRDTSEVPLYHWPRNPRQETARLRMFTGDRMGMAPALSSRFAPDRTAPGAPVRLDPLLTRLGTLKDLLEAPDKRARRLAFHLARNRPGLLAPPGLGRVGVRPRYGTEVSALYDGMAQAILSQSRARPPPLGPMPRPGPRIRRLDWPL